MGLEESVQAEDTVTKKDPVSPAIHGDEDLHLICGRVSDLVNEAERRICGSIGVGSASYAEGFAKLGKPASTLLRRDGTANSFRTDSSPCVYHFFADQPIPVSVPVVLVSGTHQSAVDHCFVAHQIVEATRGPVHCLADSFPENRLGFADVPDPDRLPVLKQSPTGPERPGEKNLYFETASQILGRKRRPVLAHGPSDAPLVLVACGQVASLARSLVSEQECLASPARLLDVQLLRPFPEEQIRDLLEESERVVLLCREDSAIDSELLAAMELLAARGADIGELEVLPLGRRPVDTEDLLDAMRSEGRVAVSPKRTMPGVEAMPGLRISATPRGQWSQELLVESAATVSRTCSRNSEGPPPFMTLDEGIDRHFVSASIGAHGKPENPLDVVFLTESSLLDPGSVLRQLESVEILILNAESRSVSETWFNLGDEIRRAIEQSGVEVWWVCPADLLDSTDVDDGVAQVLSGALIRVLSDRPAFAAFLSASSFPSELRQKGFARVQRVESGVLATAPPDVVRKSGAGVPEEADEEWRQVLRAFHLTGCGARSEWEPPRGVPLWPAVAAKLIGEVSLLSRYPLVLPGPEQTDSGAGPVPLLGAIREDGTTRVEDRTEGEESDFETVVSQIEKVARESSSATVAEALSAFEDPSVGQNGGERTELTENLRSALSGLGESWLVGFGPETITRFYSWAVEGRQAPRRLFSQEVDQLVTGLDGLLRADERLRNPEERPETLAATLGEEASAFLDLDKLSRHVPRVSGTEALSEELHRKIDETLSELRSFQESEIRQIPFFVASSSEVAGVRADGAVGRLLNDDCFEAALGFLDALLDSQSRVFRAVRVARLLLQGSYRPETHDEVFARFGWQSCTEDEIRLVPPVVVMETSTGLRSRGTGSSMSRLLRSGRPIHIVITHDELAAAEELGGTLEDLGALAMAHREAFVLQSSLARPGHLLSGLREMACTPRPSVAVVSSPLESQDGNWGWASELLSHYGRMGPCFRYSPDRGPFWADRIDISGNPDFEADQPSVAIDTDSSQAGEAALEERVTFAHAAALWPVFRSHFRVIPPSAWGEEQEPIGTYLEKFETIPPHTIPYIWVLRKGEVCRAVLTREMANACRDRRLAWKGLRELAGVGPEFERTSREQADAGPETRSETEGSEALERGRKEGAAQAVERIVGVLLGTGKGGGAATSMELILDMAAGAGPAGVQDASPPTDGGTPAAAAPATQDVGKAEAPVPVAAGPYIDSDLCTTCNDCLKINPILFVYNADNQAKIGDPLSGTYAELVKAAEKCPARCIHPGTPRPEDKTATARMVSRGAKFD